MYLTGATCLILEVVIFANFFFSWFKSYRMTVQNCTSLTKNAKLANVLFMLVNYFPDSYVGVNVEKCEKLPKTVNVANDERQLISLC